MEKGKVHFGWYVVAVIAAAIAARSPCPPRPSTDPDSDADESDSPVAAKDFGINRLRNTKSRIIASTRTTRKANTTAIPTTVMVNPFNITKFSCFVGVRPVSIANRQKYRRMPMLLQP